MNPNHHHHHQTDSILGESSVQADDALAGFLTELRAFANTDAPEMSPHLRRLATRATLDSGCPPAIAPVIDIHSARRHSLRLLVTATGITVAMGLGVGAAAAASPRFRVATTGVIGAMFGQVSAQTAPPRPTHLRHEDASHAQRSVPAEGSVERSAPAASAAPASSRPSDHPSPSRSFRSAIPALPSLPAQAQIQNPGQSRAGSHSSAIGPAGENDHSHSGSRPGAAHGTSSAHGEASSHVAGRSPANAHPRHSLSLPSSTTGSPE